MFSIRLIFAISAICITWAVEPSQNDQDKWKLTEVFENATSKCHQKIQLGSNFGIIASPNYPKPYENNLTCLWKITAKSGYQIRIAFNDFKLEEGSYNIMAERWSCFDFVRILEQYNVRPSSWSRTGRENVVLRKTWGTYCGTEKPPDRATTLSGSTLFVYFVTDLSKTNQGFIATYEQFKASSRSRSGRKNVILAKSEDEKKYHSVYLAFFLAVIVAFLLVLIGVGRVLNGSDENEPLGCCELRLMRCLLCGLPTSHVYGSGSEVRLPTPPPAYGDIVKTEEDWRRIVEQLGVASADALRRDLATEDIAVTYELQDTGTSQQSGVTGTLFVNEDSLNVNRAGPLPSTN